MATQAEETLHRCQEIILIGPVCTGKSTFLLRCFWGILNGRRRKSMADNNEATMTVPEMKLELVPVPVSDVDRAKAFYEKAGFTLGVDTRPTDTMRVVQFTPPGSACTIVFGTGMGEITEMTPGSVKGLHLVVDDINKARSALMKRGIEVGEITDFKTVKYAEFRDPDGNSWLLQEFPPEVRQPGQSFYKEEAK